jgi:hypothetical protein
VNGVNGESVVLSQEEPLGTILSPIETKVLAALKGRTSLEKLCERLNFECPQGVVFETVKSLLAKELVVVVCSAFPWGVEFDYLSREAALNEIEGSRD